MASNIAQAQVSIKGTRPLLWHAFGPDSIPAEAGRKEKSGAAGNNPQEWRTTVLFMPESKQLYLRPTYVFGCLRDGAKHTPRKRGSLQPFVAATLQVLDDFILIDRFLPEEPIPTDVTNPVFLDIQGVRNPATKARNVRYRVGASTGWETSFKIMWDKTIVSRSEMESVCTDAGRFNGLGDGRSVGYGRFEIVKFGIITE
jgi:hypothetical protein